MRYKLLFLMFFFPFTTFAQGIDNLWLMGYESWAGRPYGGVNMNFISGVLDTSWVNRKMNFEETNGVICDTNGNFLFSSNGVWIANAANDTMLNGSGLNPSSFTSQWANDTDGLTLIQANLIIPFSNNPNRYYLFHQTIDVNSTYTALYLYYSVIDVVKDSVTQKNVVLLSDSLLPEHLTACKHGNGRDWWLIAHHYGTNLYYKYLITPTGIQGPDTQSIGTNRDISAGQCVFSPDGKYFAYYSKPHGDLDIFDFDRCTGDFTFKTHVVINDSAASAGAAFSPNSKVLYLSSYKYVYQFDMTAANITNSQTTVAVWDGLSSPDPTVFFLSQLAPDGKIYINTGNATNIFHVINNPDSLGSACNFCQHCIHLPAYDAFTIANHPNYFLGALSGSQCDTLTVTNEELGIKNEIKEFPNPCVSGGNITFTYPPYAEASVISIFNTDGKEVASYRLPQWSSIQKVKLPQLASCIYIARFLQGGIGKNESVPNIKFIIE